MKITFDTDVLKRYKLSLSQLLFLLLFSNPIKQEELDDLLKRELISYKYENGKKSGKFFIMNNTNSILESIAMDSSTDNNEKERIRELAIKLRELFPKGKKPGTNYYWRCNQVEVMNKLHFFIKETNNEYTNEVIIKATERYLKTYEYDKKYMQLLKYFIFKKDSGEWKSELTSFIENLDQEGINEEIKTSRLV